MNKARRKEISALAKKLQEAKGNEELMQCIRDLDQMMADEQAYYDNMPENLQGSMRGMDSEEAISNMEEALDDLNEALEDGENREENIEDAIDLLEQIW